MAAVSSGAQIMTWSMRVSMRGSDQEGEVRERLGGIDQDHGLPAHPEGAVPAAPPGGGAGPPPGGPAGRLAPPPPDRCPPVCPGSARPAMGRLDSPPPPPPSASRASILEMSRRIRDAGSW